MSKCAGLLGKRRLRRDAKREPLMDSTQRISSLLTELEAEQASLRQELLPDKVAGGKMERVRTLLRRQEALLRSKRNEVEALLSSGKARVRDAVDKRRARLEAKLAEDPVLRAVDKVSFFFGVVAVCAIEAVMLLSPGLMPTVWHVVVLPLLAIRMKLFHRRKLHYFMLDFCYFTQAVLLLRMHLYPQSPELFAITFAFANGPLLWALALWGDSFVFHSLTRVTTVYLHLLPSFVTYAQRWHSEPWQNVCHRPDCSGSSLWDLLALPMLFVLLWCALYLVKTEYIDRAKLAADEQLQTSFRWLSRTMSGSIAHRFVWLRGQRWAPFLFMVTQLAYSAATIALVPFMFRYQLVHAAVLLAFSALIIWNGATFYIDKFPKAYLRRLELADRDWSSLFI